MNEDKDFLGREPIGKLLLSLALPTVTAQIINMLYNIVDRIYIGHIPEVGAEALTGVGVCMPLIMIVTAFAGKLFCCPNPDIHPFNRSAFNLESGFSYDLRCQQKHNRLCC